MGGSSKGGGAQTVGYRYYLGMHAVLCHGPIDKITKFSVDGRQAWYGTSTGGAISVSAENLFGGEEREGGVSGGIDVLMGRNDQTPNTYLRSQLGFDIPAFRRVVSLVFKQCYLGNNPYLKRWSIRATRIMLRLNGVEQWYPTKANVLNDMNPAHIVREVLTDPDWGMGYPEGDMDDVAFKAAADQLHTEGMGISILWDKQQTLQDFLAIILRHIDASLFVDRTTGRFVLKLARGGYVPATLPLLDEQCVTRVSDFKRATTSELTNAVTVIYWDKSTGKNNSITVQDIALTAQQLATVGTTVQYLGFTNGEIASRVAARDLRALSTPLASVTLYVTRKASSFTIGDVFRFSWGEYGVSELVMRVVNIELGELTNNLVKVSAVEDVFALGTAIYSAPPPTEWVNPIKPPQPVPYRILSEVPYYLVARTVGDQLAKDALPTAAYLMIGGTNPGASAFSAVVHVNDGGGYAQKSTINFCPTAVASASYDQNATVLDIIDGKDLDLVLPGTMVTLGSGATSTVEIAEVVSITSTQLTVNRGVMDTVPVPMGLNTRLVFIGSASRPWVGQLPTEYSLGETIKVKILPTTGQGTLPIGSAPEDSLLIHPSASRMSRPYPPGKFTINSLSYPKTASGYDGLTLNWAHRDRLQQTTGQLTKQSAANIGPEAGTTYSVRTLKKGTATVIDNQTGIVTTSAVLSPALLGDNAEIRVELYSVRGGVESLLRQYDELTRLDEDGLPIKPGFGTGAETSLHIYDGTQFLASRIAYQGSTQVTRFYGSTDGAVFEYLGTQEARRQFSTMENGLIKGSAGYASFPKEKAMAAAYKYWESTKIASFANSSPPKAWTSAALSESNLPLAMTWNSATSKFIQVMEDKSMRQSSDGITWASLGAATWPTLPPPGWAWSKGMSMEFFKVGSYWYLFHSSNNPIPYTAAGTMVMRSTDLLNWTMCPGTSFASPPTGVTGWQYYATSSMAVSGSTLLVSAVARRDTPGADLKSILLRCTDGLNFELAYEGTTSYSGLKPFGTGFVGFGSGAAHVSTDYGATWTSTALANPPTGLRSDGTNLVGRRNAGGTTALEPWYSTNGTLWTKSVFRNYNTPGPKQHWRLRTVGLTAAEVNYAELAFFDGATKHTGYTKTAGAGTGVANVDDGGNATFWVATAAHVAAGTAWVAFDMGSAVEVTAVSLRNPTGINTKMPTAVEIEASTDGVTWKPVWFEAALSWATNEDKRMEKTS